MKQTNVATIPAGQRLKQWLPDAGISKPTYHRLPADSKPAAVKIGRCLVITESAREWLQRMQQRGGVELAA